VFFCVYAVGMWIVARHATIKMLRERARIEDEGLVVIVAVTLIAIGFSFASIFSILHDKSAATPFHMVLALASVPLGWVTLQTLFAFHYARLFYAPTDEKDGKSNDKGGLDFPGTPEPGIWEFVYFSFVIGATFQTSDVGIKSTDFRLVVLFHSLSSFVFDTVLLSLSVNIGATLAG
jgi:uncharacterized membrane protein